MWCWKKCTRDMWLEQMKLIAFTTTQEFTVSVFSGYSMSFLVPGYHHQGQCDSLLLVSRNTQNLLGGRVGLQAEEEPRMQDYFSLTLWDGTFCGISRKTIQRSLKWVFTLWCCWLNLSWFLGFGIGMGLFVVFSINSWISHVKHAPTTVTKYLDCSNN